MNIKQSTTAMLICFLMITPCFSAVKYTAAYVANEHRERMSKFNFDPCIEDIYSEHTANINKVLGNQAKVSKIEAHPSEKKQILQAVMGNAIVHHDDELGDFDKRNTLAKNDYRYRHFEILRLTLDLSQALVKQKKQDRAKSIEDMMLYEMPSYKDLFSYSGLDQKTILRWFDEVFAGHSAGFYASISPIDNKCHEKAGVNYNRFNNNSTAYDDKKYYEDDELLKFAIEESLKQNPKKPIIINDQNFNRKLSVAEQIAMEEEEEINRKAAEKLQNQFDLEAEQIALEEKKREKAEKNQLKLLQEEEDRKIAQELQEELNRYNNPGPAQHNNVVNNENNFNNQFYNQQNNNNDAVLNEVLKESFDVDRVKALNTYTIFPDNPSKNGYSQCKIKINDLLSYVYDAEEDFIDIGGAKWIAKNKGEFIAKYRGYANPDEFIIPTREYNKDTKISILVYTFIKEGSPDKIQIELHSVS